MLDDVDAAIARVEADVRRAQDRATRLESLSEAASNVRGTAASPDRSVRIEVDQNGSVLELYLSDAAMEHSGSRLAGLIVRLAATAKADAQRKTVEAAEAILDDDDPALRTLREYLTPEDESAGTDAAAPGRPGQPPEPSAPWGRPGGAW